MDRRITGFGMDTITLAGPLEAKLEAMHAAGFGQVMLSARDVVGHPGGVPAAVAASATVPEPATAFLFTLAAMALRRRPR